MRRAGLTVLLAAIALATSGHIGSPDVFFQGKAGPYDVNVRVTPPSVVPGTAWVYVRALDSDVDSIGVRPAFWKAGIKGAPPPERADSVRGEKGLFAQKVWLMSHGSYSISVDVFGRRGRHAVSVPVMAMATGRLALSRPFAIMLIGFGLVLLAGLVAIVRAAASDALVEPGRVPDQVARRRGSLGALIAVPTLLIAVFGGAQWWKGEDSAYARTIFRPFVANATVVSGGGGRSLRLAIRDTAGQRFSLTPLMPDHGKMMHLFLVKESSMSAFAHLHPARDPKENVFETAVPAIPGGRYFAFADFVQETGAEFTATTMIDLPPPVSDSVSDGDDSWIVDAFGVPAAPGARSVVGRGLTLQWETADPLTAGRDIVLKFSLRDAHDNIVPVEPYLGMAAHAVVVRDDASVFVHLHPMGTMSMASLQSFELRNRGDTSADGRLRDPHAGMKTPEVEQSGSFSFPYAFPKPGRYRIWVQVRNSGRVLTGDYEALVK